MTVKWQSRKGCVITLATPLLDSHFNDMQEVTGPLFSLSTEQLCHKDPVWCPKSSRTSRRLPVIEACPILLLKTVAPREETVSECRKDLK